MTHEPAPIRPAHLHVGPEGMLLACSFQDLTAEDEMDRLEILLGLEASIEELRQLRQTAIAQHDGPVPTATRPVCAYWSRDGCDDYRFWIESHPEEQLDQAPGVVCGTHIVEWTSEHGGHEWLLREDDTLVTYPDDPRPSGIVQIAMDDQEDWP